MSNEAKTYGLYLGVISILISVVFYATGMLEIGKNDPIQSVIGLAVLIVMFVLAALAQKKRQEGFLSYGEGFKTMLGVGVISSLLSLTWMAVLILVLEPGYQETLLDNTYEQMIQQNPDMSDEQLEMGLEWTRKFTTPSWMIMFTLFGALLMSAIFAAIIAIFVKKNKSIFESTDA